MTFDIRVCRSGPSSWLSSRVFVASGAMVAHRLAASLMPKDPAIDCVIDDIERRFAKVARRDLTTIRCYSYLHRIYP